jgi:SAM-dependent methyltransferase
MSWSGLGDWWLNELASDPAYEKVVTPMLLDLLRPQAGHSYLDLGSGEGRVMRSVKESGAEVYGLELNPYLAQRSTEVGPTVVGELPDLSAFEPESFDGVYCVLVLEHVSDSDRLFAESAGLVEPGGVFVLVSNHPTWTAPGSTPVTDDDGEVLLRPGDYFGEGAVEVPAGGRKVLFHHRSMSILLRSAAAAGWCLQEMVEAPHHDLENQSGIPRLLGCRWHRER